MQCTDCHSPGSFGQDDPYRHNATTLACTACHEPLWIDHVLPYLNSYLRAVIATLERWVDVLKN